ncbi:hypothetical protein FACS189464_2510 [Bacteroidia bacterium]|nr:hypothetical protein FACS189464_2510 [Bacteroidia bacterium]
MNMNKVFKVEMKSMLYYLFSQKYFSGIFYQKFGEALNYFNTHTHNITQIYTLYYIRPRII